MLEFHESAALMQSAKSACRAGTGHTRFATLPLRCPQTAMRSDRMNWMERSFSAPCRAVQECGKVRGAPDSHTADEEGQEAAPASGASPIGGWRVSDQ